MEGEILEFLGKILAYGGGAASVAYLIFSFLGKKTIEDWFAKRLKKFEYDLNALFNRVSKIHEKEIEVLPKAWEKLHDLLELNRQFILKTHNLPEIDDMLPEKLESFLLEQNFTSEEIQTITSKPNCKKDWYFWVLSERVGNACLDFQDYIDKNAIFLSSDIKSKFQEAEDIIRTSWATRDTAEKSSERRKGITEAGQILRKKIPPVMKEIEDLVQKRLHFHEA